MLLYWLVCFHGNYGPALMDSKGAVILRRAPIMRNMAMSAVALLTAIGVFAIDIPNFTD